MTPFAWSEEAESWYAEPMDDSKQNRVCKEGLRKCVDNPFWEVSPPKKVTPFTDEVQIKMLQSILDKQQRHQKKPTSGDAFTTSANDLIRQAITVLQAGEVAQS